MTDPNLPPQYGQQVPPYAQHPTQQQFGPGPDQPGPGQFGQPPIGLPPGQWQSPQPAPKPNRRFGPSFWIVGGGLALVLLVYAFAGAGGSILFVAGLAAFFTGLYSMASERRSWAGLPHRKAAGAVLAAGIACALLGIVASVSGGGGSKPADAAPAPTVTVTAAPATSAQLEADAAAKLKAREDAVAKREAAVGTAEKAATKTFGQGTWTVGSDIEPGTYRTTKAVVGDCSWKITRTGSNGKDYIAYDYFVKGGFPQVNLAEGQTFNTDGCGDWVKQ